MSTPCWRISLHRLLNPNQTNDRRLAIVGIGNEIRGDDAVGMLIARSLLTRQLESDSANILILPAGHAPENVTGALRRFAPHLVLLVDAADMGEAPGLIRWLGMDEIDGVSASTHSLPLSILARYLKLELSCNVALLGIQPANLQMGEVLSLEVSQAVVEIIEGISTIVFPVLSNPASVTMRGTISSQPTAIK